MRFFRPTRVTWLVLALPAMGAALVRALGWDAGFFALYIVMLELPFRLWSALGVPVGRRTDFYGWADPGRFGLTLILLTDVVVWYVVASGVAAAWRTAGRRARS